jgi:hypothetical protein
LNRKGSQGFEALRVFILKVFSFDRGVRILCLFVLVLFACYLVDGLVDSVQEVLLRLASDRALNLSVKLSLLFQLSHLLALPYVMYLIVRELVHDSFREA